MVAPAIERGNLAVLCLEAGLTRSESAVLMSHCGDGYSKAEVAARLGISEHAVECHLSNAGRKIREEAHRMEWQQRIHETVLRLRERVQTARTATALQNAELTSVMRSS